MIKCAQLCILPSVYKLWMVTKCRQVGAQGGSGGSLGSDFSDWKRPQLRPTFSVFCVPRVKAANCGTEFKVYGSFSFKN